MDRLVKDTVYPTGMNSGAKSEYIKQDARNMLDCNHPNYKRLIEICGLAGVRVDFVVEAAKSGKRSKVEWDVLRETREEEAGEEI